MFRCRTWVKVRVGVNIRVGVRFRVRVMLRVRGGVGLLIGAVNALVRTTHYSMLKQTKAYPRPDIYRLVGCE